jgi:signal transduction histidine kinase
MKLSQFIRHDINGIVDEWSVFARTIPASDLLDLKALENDARLILLRIAGEMDKPQNDAESASKSRGERDTDVGSADSAAQTHAGARLADGFNLIEMVSEYRALRASVIRRWRAQKDPDAGALDELTLFNEGLDQALTESVKRFTDRVDKARELFMGALGHDLRTPLQIIMQCTRYLDLPETPTRSHAQMKGHIAESAETINTMVEDLLDVVRTKLGGSFPLSGLPADLVRICCRTIDEVRLANPGVNFLADVPAVLSGVWDRARLHQLFTNLLKNAVQHGDVTKPITVAVRQEGQRAVVTVHNEGQPIPQHLLSKLFDPLTRGENIPDHKRGASLGLGLYIANTIACAHGGRIDVDSTTERGTTFTVSLPISSSGFQPPGTSGNRLHL